ncbi:hypothetical protein ACFYR1_21640 [Streptomyces canus]|uniref:hypothetical protein n=1 Tax=Streptomyces canus TaxID=58343 RepID=UPI0036BF6739
MDDDGHFGESVVATYDESSAEMFAPDAVEPAVEVLAGFDRASRPGWVGPEHWGLPVLHDTVRAYVAWAD